MREPVFNGNQLRLARHFWGMTLNDIAEGIEKTRQYVSQLETKGKLREDDKTVESMAQLLEVTPSFFYRQATTPLSEEQANFRKLATTKTSMKQKILARGTVFDEVVDFIGTKVRLPAIDFPDHSGAETIDEIERAAEKVRIHWGLGYGPISHMVRVVERAGAVVTFFHDASTEVDALSITSKRPIIVRNDAKKSPFRLRFDMAHELGHLVLHEGLTTGDRKTESEANRFAAAFLLPRSTFIKAFPRRGSRIDWNGLSEMKMEFQVTKAAILYRARSLGILDDYQYRGAIITMKNRGESIDEIEDKFIISEEAEVLPAAMKILHESHKISHQDLANKIGVTSQFLSQIVPSNVEATKTPTPPKLRLVTS